MPRLEWRRPRTRTLELAGIIGPIWFTTFVILQGFLLPDYSHVRLPISALAAWPTGWIQDINFCVTGVLGMAFAVALHRGVRPTRRGRAGAVLLVLGGLGVVWDGIFPWKMVDGVPAETPAHVIGAVMTFAATGFGFIVFSRRMNADPRWRGLATYTMLTGSAILLLFIAVGFFAIDDGTPLHAWAGLLQRVLCAVWFLCSIVLAIRLRKASGRGDGEPLRNTKADYHDGVNSGWREISRTLELTLRSAVAE
jgi:hypothetical membrane protein